MYYTLFEEAFRQLDEETDLSRNGQRVDRNTVDWLLIQVDRIVETIGEDSPELNVDSRTNCWNCFWE